MGSTWESLLQALVDCRNRNDFRSEPEHDEARRDNLEWIVQTMLEKLRDEAEQSTLTIGYSLAKQKFKAHKVMTPEEYAAMPIVGWHEVCRDFDGFGGVGVRFLGTSR